MTKRAPPKKRVKGATGLASLTAAERARLVREIADELHDVRRSPAKTMSWFQSLRNPAKIVLASVIILAAMQLTAHGRDESRKIIAKMWTLLGIIPTTVNGGLALATDAKTLTNYAIEKGTDFVRGWLKMLKDLGRSAVILARNPLLIKGGASIRALMDSIVKRYPDEASITLSKTPHMKATGHASTKSLAVEWVPALVWIYNEYQKKRDLGVYSTNVVLQNEKRLLGIIKRFNELEASLILPETFN